VFAACTLGFSLGEQSKGKSAMPATSSKKFLGGYVLLVGGPLLGLVAMLHAGRGLNAPISVQGVWDIRVSKSPCADGSRSEERVAMEVVQSGSHLFLSVPDEPGNRAEGAIASTAIAVPLLAFPSLEQAIECHEGRPLSLTATVNSPKAPSSMAGVLSISGCDFCPRIRFTAQRRPAPRPAEGH
jgi:hypothetical protein